MRKILILICVICLPVTYAHGALNCSNPVPLSLYVPYNGNNSYGNSNVSRYNCIGWTDTGPEVVHTITTTEVGDLTATLAAYDPYQFDIFILSSCNKDACVAGGYDVATYYNAPVGTYYIVVDGFQGHTGSYTLTVGSGTCGGDWAEWVNGQSCYCGGLQNSPVPFVSRGNGLLDARMASKDQLEYWNSYADIYSPVNLDTGYGSLNNGINEINTFITHSESLSRYGFYMHPELYGVAIIMTESCFGTFNECQEFSPASCGSFVETDVLINSGFVLPWTTNPNNNNDALVQTTALHELGHTWGAHHVFSLPAFGDTFSTMNYLNDDSGRFITRMDANTIRAHYPSSAQTLTDVGIFPFIYGNEDYAETYASVSPTSVLAGGNINISNFLIQNIGTNIAEDTVITFYLSADTKIENSDHAIGTVNYSSLAVNADNDLNATLTIPHSVPAGSHYIGAIVSVGGVEDSIGLNNRFIIGHQYRTKITVTCVLPPTAHSNPSPEDDVIGVPITAELDWDDAPGATSYDVYLGTSSPPGFAGNARESFFDPVRLANDTRYYWKVIAKNNCGQIDGPEWSFVTTCNLPPATPNNPSPPDGDTGVPITVDLDWDDASGATSYDVYFGASSPPPIVGNVSESFYDPGLLAGYTQYFWKVVAKNDCGKTSGDEWSFATNDLEACLIVPYDYPTIQGAVDAADDGCVIIVKPGTGIYYENIVLNNKKITLRADGEVTVNGNQNGTVVTFEDDRGSVLDGFTITNGSGTAYIPEQVNTYGGGIRCDRSSPSIMNCLITNNSVTGSGGGIGSHASSDHRYAPTITNCTISGNSAESGGGISCWSYSSASVTNCTITGNTADGGGGIYSSYSTPEVLNSIIWGNGSDQINFNSYGTPIITYSNIQGGYSGTGNINADPKFAGGGNYHLTQTSPCIDKGTSTGAPDNDIDGDSRPKDGDGDGFSECDMGSDEYCVLLTWYKDNDNDGYSDGTTLEKCDRPDRYKLLEELRGDPANAEYQDCDDDDPSRYPSNPEICDGADNNCDGVIDENLHAVDDGDVNGDENITFQDALLVFEHYLGIIQLSPCQQATADVNADGSITPGDGLCILKKNLGLSSCLGE